MSSRRPEEQEREEVFEHDLEQQKEVALRGLGSWRSYEGTYCTAEQAAVLGQYERASRDDRVRMLEGSGRQIAEALLRLLVIKAPEPLKYLLVLVDEIFEGMGHEKRADRLRHFLDLRAVSESLPLEPFVLLLDMPDHYVQYLAAQQAGTLLFAQHESARDADLDAVLRWAVATLRASTDDSAARPTVVQRHHQRAAVKCLQLVLQNDGARHKFKKLSGLQLLAAVLNVQYKAVMENKQHQQEMASLSSLGTTAAGSSSSKMVAAAGPTPDFGQPANGNKSGRDLQLIYETLFAVWLMSFNVDIASKDFTGTSIILNTVRLLREVDQEKVRRVGLATLRNLAAKAENDEAMIHAGFWKVVQQLSGKRWGDDDIAGDVEFLLQQMEAKMMDMTTWDRYKQELLSGQLEWSPAHKSDKFWRENVAQFNTANFELVGVLAALLDSKESLTQAIACHDLGEFARHHPIGKRILHEHNIKSKILMLIDSHDLQVQQQSLLALQKLMITNFFEAK